MWAFIVRRLLINVPVYLGIVALLMAALRVQDPAAVYLGKNKTLEQIDAFNHEKGLDRSFAVQYADFVSDVVRFDFTEESWKWEGLTVRQILVGSIPASLSITVPTLALSVCISIVVALISAFYRGRLPDRLLVFFAVLGMSVSHLVYIIFGQFFGAFWPYHDDWATKPFAIQGYQPWLLSASPLQVWSTFCLLPVMIGVIVAMGYDTRFYRAVMVEETGRDYIVTAVAKGASRRKVMFVHMLKNALIPIITSVMATLPFLITGSILLERYFNIPGMGNQLLTALNDKDFPVIQAFVAVIAAIFIVSIILTDVLYALVDPRVRLT